MSDLPQGLPELPPVPDGFDRWVYRGMGWRSLVEVTASYLHPENGQWEPCGQRKPGGISQNHYIEAVKAAPADDAGVVTKTWTELANQELAERHAREARAIPEPTEIHPQERCEYAVAHIDNSLGDEDEGLCFATWNGEFISVETDKPLIEFEGDRIIEFWPLKRGTGLKRPDALIAADRRGK